MPQLASVATHEMSPLATWLVRKRVAISFILFTTVLIWSAVLGTIPREFIVGYDALTICAVTMVVVGLGIRSWAAGTLNKNREVTKQGIYSVMRNPLYFGSFLMMCGFSLQLNHPVAPLIAVAILVPVYYFAVRNEEQRLEGWYGDDWRNYAARVNRFLPTRLAFDFSNWSFAQWLKNGEYRAVLTTMAIYGAVEIWETISFPNNS